MARRLTRRFVAILDAESQEVPNAGEERLLAIGLVMKSQPAQPVDLCLLPGQESLDFVHATRCPRVTRRKRTTVVAA